MAKECKIPEAKTDHIDMIKSGEGDWSPVSIQQDPLGVYLEAVLLDEDGRVLVKPDAVRSILSFTRMWDRNLKAQGFLEAAGTK